MSDIDDGSDSCPSSLSTSSGRSASGNIVKPFVTWLVTFFLLLQAHFHIRSFVLEINMKFLRCFFMTLGKVYSVCSTIGNLLSGSLYLARKHCGIDPDSFKNCVCKQCHHVWKLY